MHASVVAIHQRGAWLHAQGQTETGPQLVHHLKATGVLAPGGQPYKVGRGIYKAINAAETAIKKSYGLLEAEKISMSFTKIDGNYAY